MLLRKGLICEVVGKTNVTNSFLPDHRQTFYLIGNLEQRREAAFQRQHCAVCLLEYSWASWGGLRATHAAPQERESLMMALCSFYIHCPRSSWIWASF